VEVADCGCKGQVFVDVALFLPVAAFDANLPKSQRTLEVCFLVNTHDNFESRKLFSHDLGGAYTLLVTDN
jgi:hypothetical protein